MATVTSGSYQMDSAAAYTGGSYTVPAGKFLFFQAYGYATFTTLASGSVSVSFTISVDGTTILNKSYNDPSSSAKTLVTLSDTGQGFYAGPGAVITYSSSFSGTLSSSGTMSISGVLFVNT